MPKDFQRTDRLSELVQRELAQIIQRELNDPRLGMVTISAVEITRDLAYAKIYVTIFDTDEQIQKSMKILNHAASFLRTLLAKRIKIRIIPELIFVYDVSIRDGQRLSSLIDAALAEDKRKAKQHSDDE